MTDDLLRFEYGSDTICEFKILSDLKIKDIPTSPDEIIKVINDNYPISKKAIKEHFIAGVVDRLNELGEKIESNEKIKINKALRKRYKNLYQKYDLGDPEGILRTVRNWLDDKTEISTAPDNREKLFIFCMVLEMDLKTTAEFFLKYFLTLPFNFKNIEDIVFYYCLKNNKDIKWALSTIKCISFESLENNSEMNVETSAIRTILDEKNDDSILQFLKNNHFERNAWFSSAKKEIKIIIQKYETEKSHNKLLENIYGKGYNFRDVKKSDKNNDVLLPKRFTTNLLEPVVLSNILTNKKAVSYDEVRKALILLNFYDYYYELEKADFSMDIKDAFNEFIENTDELLCKCGFSPLYPYNSYDWVILHCANSCSPIKMFQQIFVDFDK